MLRAVEGTCDAHIPAWSTLQVFADAKTQLSANIAALITAIGLQGTGTRGATAQKTANRRAVTPDLLNLAHAVRLASTLAGHTQQAMESTITQSELDAMGANAFLGYASRIEAFAKTMGVEVTDGLQPYNWPTTAITAFSARLAAFCLSIDEPKHAKADRKQATADIARLIAESLTLLKDRMDLAGELLKATQPAFYTEYWIVRQIIDPGYTTRALLVTIIDAATGLPLAAVKATIAPGDRVKSTGPVGRFYIQTLKPGDYTITLSKSGYLSATQPVSIVAGQAAMVAVSLQPETE